jgi:NADPH-dependent glutamate synthase beta subunit-like oxidoreductase
MPADPAEVEEAEREGVDIRLMTAPVEVVVVDGRVKALRCIETTLGQPDESGRRRPVPVEGSEFEIGASRIITAIGQRPASTVTSGVDGVDRDERDRVRARDTLQTSLEWVFAGGDTVTGPATVIEAVAAGKQAAKSIARFVRGEDLTERSPIPIPRMKVEEATDLDDDEKSELVREPMPAMAIKERGGSFELVETGYTEQLARAEAHRCLRCDINR